MSCGGGCRRGSALALLWLWHRLAAVAPIGPLAREHPCTVSAALKRKKKKKKQRNKKLKKPSALFLFFWLGRGPKEISFIGLSPLTTPTLEILYDASIFRCVDFQARVLQTQTTQFIACLSN